MPELTFEIPSERSTLVEEIKREERVRVVDVAERIKDLKHRYQQFARHAQFKPGDIVRWKKKLKNKKRPAYGEPAIVIDVLKEPRIDPEAEGGSAYFQEPLDIVLGLIGEDGDFDFFHYDHRRFELWESGAQAKTSKTGPTPKRSG
jgi:hypothetical protein